MPADSGPAGSEQLRAGRLGDLAEAAAGTISGSRRPRGGRGRPPSGSAWPVYVLLYDDAQRIDECGLGARLDTYMHEPDELLGASTACSPTTRSPGGSAALSAQLQASPGTARAADLIEQQYVNGWQLFAQADWAARA